MSRSVKPLRYSRICTTISFISSSFQKCCRIGFDPVGGLAPFEAERTSACRRNSSARSLTAAIVMSHPRKKASSESRTCFLRTFSSTSRLCKSNRCTLTKARCSAKHSFTSDDSVKGTGLRCVRISAKAFMGLIHSDSSGGQEFSKIDSLPSIRAQ
jgi:hypothetical protein